VSAIGHPARGSIRLEVNGEPRQDGDLAQMIWKTPEVIAYLSGLFTLAPGDLIFTGTPKGVGPVQRGDRLDGRIEGVGEFRVDVV
jgi:fumarylpyruvate hydrolase